MKNFKFTCNDGFTKTFSAMTVEEAVDMAMMDEEVKAHGATNHPEMASKTPEEMKQMFMSMVTEEMAAPAAGAM